MLENIIRNLISINNKMIKRNVEYDIFDSQRDTLIDILKEKRYEEILMNG